jgi:hypothetical protein
MLISPEYAEQNRQLHAERDDYGRSSIVWARFVDKLIENEGYTSTLDYGCGKGMLATLLATRNKVVAEYDPAIPGKDGPPEPAELVVCTDVLEHVEHEHLSEVLCDLRRVTKRKLFFSISTRPANKTLPDGRNAHLIIKPAEWWRKKLAAKFEIVTFEVTEGVVYGQAVPHGVYRKAKSRRPITPQMVAQIERDMATINALSDDFNQVRTYNLWESIDDKAADLQVVVSILEHLPDVHLALNDIISLTRKVVIIIVKMDEQRNEEWWRSLLEKRFRLADWQVQDGHLMMTGTVKVNVQGVVAVGAVDSDKRWDQVKAACQRISKRISPAPVHERRAIIACYGPSLRDTIEHLRQAAADPNADVVSVSGAHDFLIEHGIVPKYHVECDPRPHKADNIERGHPDVQYLLASTIHEVLFNKLEGHDVRLWHVATPEHSMKLITELRENPKHIISGGGSVGLRSIPLMYTMGYRSMSIFAMDCSFADQGKQQWAGKHAGKKQDLAEVECNGRTFVSSPILMSYAANFWEMVQKVEDLDVRLYGDGLLQEMARFYTSYGVLKAA